MFAYIQKKYDFTNYQILQLEYLLKTILSETSKIAIMLFVFRHNILLYLFSLFILLEIRTFSGGIHCKTYLSCFTATLFYFTSAMYILPNVSLPLGIELVLMFICTIVNYAFSPITAPGHLKLSDTVVMRCKYHTAIVGIIYTYIIYIFPKSHFVQTGFWIMQLHTLQLIFAKIRNEVNNEEKII